VLPEALLANGKKAKVWMQCTRGPEEEEEREEPQDDEVEVEEEEQDQDEDEDEEEEDDRPRDRSVLVFELGVGACLAAAWPVMAWRKRRMRQGYLPL
jgi:hypothetical protein